MGDYEHSNTQHLYKNCSDEAKKEPIKGLVLTDDETKKIKLGRAEMLKVAEPFQDEVRCSVVKWKQDFLIDRATQAYNDVKEGKDPKIRFFDGKVCLFDEVMRAMVRHSDKACLEKYGAYPKEILRSLTRVDVLEQIYKIAIEHKQKSLDLEDEPYCPEVEYQKEIDGIISGEDKDFDEFFYKKKLIFETPDEELPYTELVEKKYDLKFLNRYLWLVQQKTGYITAENQKIRKIKSLQILEAAQLRPKNTPSYYRNESVDGNSVPPINMWERIASGGTFEGIYKPRRRTKESSYSRLDSRFVQFVQTENGIRTYEGGYKHVNPESNVRWAKLTPDMKAWITRNKRRKRN